MENRGSKRLTDAFRVFLLGGLIVSIATTGCAIHHYHHFEEGVVVPPAGALASPPSTQGSQPPSSPSDSPAESSPVSSWVVAVSYQPPEPGEKSGPAKNGNEVLAPPRKLDEPKAAKGSTPESIEPSGKVTFDQVVTATLLADPKIRAGLEAINQANADFLTSSLRPNPTLLTDGLLLPLRRFTPDRTGGPPQTDVLLSYPIDWFLFGKRVAAMASAAQGVRQSEAEYADLIRQRVTATALAFHDVLEAKALLDLARQDTENLRRLETATKKAVDAGGRPVVELNRVRLDLLKSQQALREAEAALTVAKAKLRSLFGRIEPDPAFDVDGNLDAPLKAQPLPIEEAFVLAQQNRPDIQSLRWQVAKAQADIVVERRKAFPQVTPQFGYTRQFQTEALGQPDADSWNVAVTTSLPLFDRNQGNRAKAQSVEAQQNFNLQAAVVDLRAEIEQVVQDFRTAYQNAQAIAQQQLKLAGQVLDSITKAYEAGGRPLIEVLDAQRNYRETYRLYISSRANYWRAVYRFNSAIGKQIPPHDEPTQ